MKLRLLILGFCLCSCGTNVLQNTTAAIRQNPDVTSDPNTPGSDSVAPDNAMNSNQAAAAADSASSRPPNSLRGVPADAVDGSTERGGYGGMSFRSSPEQVVVRYEATLWVPSNPPASGSVFIWPGLQPDGAAKPYGVLQPVLVWGPVCTSSGTNPPKNYKSWWIAGFYVTDTCYVGKAMAVSVGDALRLSMALDNNVWHQTIVNLTTQQTVTFNYDLKGQNQVWPIFNIEPVKQNPTEPVAAANIQITYANPLAAAPKLHNIGKNDAMTAVKLSADKKTISIDGLVLRPEGVQ